MLLLGALASIGVGAGASAASAASGYVTASLNLRAGPGTYYPAVTVMHAGDRVEIYGCLPGWTWCDINWHGFRGWAAGRYLQVIYLSRPRPVYLYGRSIGVPFISFNINIYWTQHYRNRTFYTQLPRFGGKPGPTVTFNPPPKQPPAPPRRLNNPPPTTTYVIPGNNPRRGPTVGNGSGGPNVFVPGNNPQGGPTVRNSPGGPNPGNQGCPPGYHRDKGMCVK